MTEIDKLAKLYAINRGYNRRWGKGNQPFQIITRLVEEVGELAEQVNHFEDSGVKRQKHGEPDRLHLAKEVRDVLLCALQICQYYHVESELDAHIEQTYTRMVKEGTIQPPANEML